MIGNGVLVITDCLVLGMFGMRCFLVGVICLGLDCLLVVRWFGVLWLSFVCWCLVYFVAGYVWLCDLVVRWLWFSCWFSCCFVYCSL